MQEKVRLSWKNIDARRKKLEKAEDSSIVSNAEGLFKEIMESEGCGRFSDRQVRLAVAAVMM